MCSVLLLSLEYSRHIVLCFLQNLSEKSCLFQFLFSVVEFLLFWHHELHLTNINLTSQKMCVAYIHLIKILFDTPFDIFPLYFFFVVVVCFFFCVSVNQIFI